MLTVRQGLAFGGLFAVAVATPVACFYPSYTFDDTGSGGAGAEPSTSTTTTTGGGATTTTTSSTTSSTVGPGGGGNGGGGNEGGGGATASSSSSTGGSGGEDCLNGSDDDNDGKADCADPKCQTDYECVPTIPVGWSGHVALFEGVPAQKPACPPEFPSAAPYEGNNTLLPGNATCSGCTCGNASGQECTMTADVDPTQAGAQTLVIGNLACNMSSNFLGGFSPPVPWTGACTTFGGGYNGGDTTCNGPCNVSVSSAPPVVAGGSCTAAGGVITKPMPTWAIAGKACGPTTVGSGCGAGNACQPKTKAPFAGGLCIYKAGDNMCPGNQFTDKHVFYEGFTDGRTCSACGCGAPSGGTCALQIHIYSDAFVDTCNTQVTTFPAGGCGDLVGNPAVFGRSYTVTTPPTGSTCTATPGGGVIQGMVTETTPTTFCCLP